MKDATTPCCHVIWVLEIWLSALSVLMKLKYSKSSGRISDWWVIAKLKTTQPLPLLIFVVMFAGQSWIKAPELRTCLCQRRSVVTASLNSHSKRCFQSSACSDKTTQSLWHSDSTFLGSFFFFFKSSSSAATGPFPVQEASMNSGIWLLFYYDFASSNKMKPLMPEMNNTDYLVTISLLVCPCVGFLTQQVSSQLFEVMPWRQVKGQWVIRAGVTLHTVIQGRMTGEAASMLRAHTRVTAAQRSQITPPPPTMSTEPGQGGVPVWWITFPFPLFTWRGDGSRMYYRKCVCVSAGKV